MDVAELIERCASGDRPEMVFFWRHVPTVDGPGPWMFSQWYRSPFVVDGQTYATAEHWMMAGKARLFGDDEAAARIVASTDPAEAQAIGREVSGFDERAWSKASRDIVVTGNLHKFSQHEAARSHLLATGDSVLVEASPHDLVWGIGWRAEDPQAAEPTAWRGRNLLGFALMDVRSLLRS